MGDRGGKKDKGKREQRKKAKLSIKEKRKAKVDSANGVVAVLKAGR